MIKIGIIVKFAGPDNVVRDSVGSSVTFRDNYAHVQQQGYVEAIPVERIYSISPKIIDPGN